MVNKKSIQKSSKRNKKNLINFLQFPRHKSFSLLKTSFSLRLKKWVNVCLETDQECKYMKKKCKLLEYFE